MTVVGVPSIAAPRADRVEPAGWPEPADPVARRAALVGVAAGTPGAAVVVGVLAATAPRVAALLLVVAAPQRC